MKDITFKAVAQFSNAEGDTFYLLNSGQCVDVETLQSTDNHPFVYDKARKCWTLPVKTGSLNVDLYIFDVVHVANAFGIYDMVMC